MTQANTGVLNPSEKRAISYNVIQGKILLPIVSIGLAILLDQVLPRAIEQKNVPQPYFSYILGIVLLGYLGDVSSWNQSGQHQKRGKIYGAIFGRNHIAFQCFKYYNG